MPRSVTPTVESIKGIRVSAVKAGIKGSGNFDLGLIVSDKPASAAGVFTKNKVVSPSVTVTRNHLRSSKGTARAILVNAGNANTCTGVQGVADAKACAGQVSQLVDCNPREVLVCSTGIIGHPLPMEKMHRGIDKVYGALRKTRKGLFAKAIMTTDTVPKMAGAKPRGLGGAAIAGVCKGSGMIAPNMATMLGFIVTDASVSSGVLKTALSSVVDDTFNAVTVDGDCSTNDSVLILATGAKGGPVINRATGKRYGVFLRGLHDVCFSLAEQIARDGEGATKLVRVEVTGASSVSDARKAARTVAESPLVKTAMFGNDPNWGRILCAVGRSGCSLDESKTHVSICGVPLFTKGSPAGFDAAVVSRKMKSKEVVVAVDLGVGGCGHTMLTCDFSYDYVKINAEYHT